MIAAKHSGLSDRIQKARNCRRSSARVYSSNIARIHREFLPRTKYSQDLSWLGSNSSQLLTKLKKIENINTQRNLLAAAVVALDLLKQPKKKESYVKQIAVLNKLKEERAQSGEMTTKQAEKFIEWKSVIKLRRLLNRTVRLGKYYTRKKVTRNEFQTMQQNLVLHLYTEIPPVRNDWSDVQFVSEKEWEDMPEQLKKTTNNLVLARGGYRVYWAKYKTVDKHGVIMQLIPKTLGGLLKRHIRFLKEHYPDTRNLLLTLVGTPMTRNALTKFLQRLFYKHFRKKISTTALRSVFISHKFSKSQLEEQRTVAKAMHHTPAVQRDVYAKNLPGS